MQAYVLRRLLLMVPSILGLTLLTFILVRVMPGETVDVLMGESGRFTEEDIADMRAEWNLDKSLPVQYGIWLRDLSRGDLGQSFYYDAPVTDLIWPRLWVSAELAFLAGMGALILGVLLGSMAAAFVGRPADYLIRVISVFGQALPSFWLGLMTLTFSAYYLKWLPPVAYARPWEDPWVNLQQVGLAAISLSLVLSAVTMRLTRNGLLEILRSDYIRTARAKGMGGRAVMLHHALPNVMMPVITFAGLEMVTLLGGTVIIEQVFNLPGMGRQLLQAIRVRDYNTLQGMVLIFGMIVVVFNLVVDLSYVWLDPRLRYR